MKDVTWETCSLRAWLNSEFLNTAFSAEEQSRIQTTAVDNSDAQGVDWRIASGLPENTTGGNNTQDKVFLLSCTEAYRYLNVTNVDNDNKKARIAPTPYALAMGAWGNDDYKTADGDRYTSSWWLRSPGEFQDRAAYVFYGGELASEKVNVFPMTCAVRPAIWVNLN